MNHFKNGTPYTEQWQDTSAEFADEEFLTEFEDDDDEEGYATEFDDDDDEEGYATEFDDDDDDEDERFSTEFDDDDDEEGYATEFDDDYDDEAISSDGEFLLKALRGVRRIVRRPKKRRSSKSFRPRKFLRHRVGKGRYRINPRSRTRGSIRLGRRRIPFRLPRNLATKKDIKQLAAQVRKDIRLNGVAVKRNAAGIRSAIGIARKANVGVKDVDRKYRKAALQQTKATREVGKRVNALKKAQDSAQAQARQQAMFSMFMSPELEEITVKEEGVVGATERKFKVTKSEFETNLLPLMMGMSGNNATGQGGMDPMMMFAMMQAFND